MIEVCPLMKLRDRLGHYVDAAEKDGKRVVILRHGQEAAALVSIADLNLLEQAAAKSLSYAEYQTAQNLAAFKAIKEGLDDI